MCGLWITVVFIVVSVVSLSCWIVGLLVQPHVIGAVVAVEVITMLYCITDCFVYLDIVVFIHRVD